MTASQATEFIWIATDQNLTAFVNSLYIYILLGVLLCSIAEYFLRVVPYFYELVGRLKIQPTSKNCQRYFTSKRLTRDLLSNTPNCYVRAGEFRGYLVTGLRDRSMRSGTELAREI